MNLCRTGNGNDPRLLGKHPGKRNLRRGCASLLAKLSQLINNNLICFSIVLAESGYDVTKVRLIKLRVGVDCPSEESPARRAIRNNADPAFFKYWKDLSFSFSQPNRVLPPQPCDGKDHMRPAERRDP